MTSVDEGIASAGDPFGASPPRWRARAGGTADAGRVALSGIRRRARDERRFRSLVGAIETATIVAAVGAAVLVERLAPAPGERGEVGPLTGTAVLVAAAWLVSLAALGSRESRTLGRGRREHVRVVVASILAFGILAMAFEAFGAEGLRPYIAVACPVGIALLLATRVCARAWLQRTRSLGRHQSHVVVLGGAECIARITASVLADPRSGYRIAGTVVVDPGAPLDQTLATVSRALDAHGSDTIIVGDAVATDARFVRRLAWSLEGRATDVLLASGVTQVAPARLAVDELDGDRFLRLALSDPARKNRVKRAFDVVAAGALVILFSPVFVAVAVAIAVSSPGPVIYRQTRIGRGGEPFRMLKFRSMRVDADAELAALLAGQGGGDTPLFKPTHDPRVTRLGRLLRKYSLDELPQLFNVLGGSMSLVGPRPQIADEVALYTDGAARRLRTPPGLTGLWQVSGRSTLSWQQAMRLDLYYVENWSLASDLSILARTARAVLAPGESAR